MGMHIPPHKVGDTVELSELNGEPRDFTLAGSWACTLKTKDGQVLPATLFKLKPAANSSVVSLEDPPLLLVGNEENSLLGATLWRAGVEVNDAILKRENLHMQYLTGRFTAKPLEGVTKGWTAELTVAPNHQEGGMIQAREIIRKGVDPRDNITRHYHVSSVTLG